MEMTENNGTTFRVGDLAYLVDGEHIVLVLGTHDSKAWVTPTAGPPYSYLTLDTSRLCMMKPSMPVSWRNVYPTQVALPEYNVRADADRAANASNRLGVIVRYSDGTYKLEVTS